MVGVAGDQDDRDVGGDRVERGDRGLLGPEPGAVAGGDEGAGAVAEPVADPGQGLGGRLRAGQVEPVATGGPLGQVDVRVPQPRDRPAPLRVVLLDPGGVVEPVPDLADGPLLDEHVDRADPPAPPPQLDHPDVTQDEVGHGPTLSTGRRDSP